MPLRLTGSFLAIAARMVVQPRAALVVEDNPDFADIFRRLLAPWNLEIHTATTLAGALEIVSRRSFDFYAIDLQLADGDSAELLSRLAERGETTSSRCIVVTAFPIVATYFSSFPIVSKTQLSSLGPHLFRILGDPFEASGASRAPASVAASS